MTLVRKAYRLKLYPNRGQSRAFARHAGACRWLWNHFLAMQKDIIRLPADACGDPTAGAAASAAARHGSAKQEPRYRSTSYLG